MTSGGGAEIRTVPVESASGQLRAGKSEGFLKTPTISTFATFSPDGRWLAYANPEAVVYEARPNLYSLGSSLHKVFRVMSVF